MAVGYAVQALALSLVIAPNAHGPSLYASVVKFEEKLTLPNGSRPLIDYARYYKLRFVFGRDTKGRRRTEPIVEFKYISQDVRPGIQIVSGELPRQSRTDGGCLVVDGVFRLRDLKLLYIECAPWR